VLAPYVEGVLYRITDARGWEGLDACEGVPTLYDRVSTLVVDHQGLTVNAWTYEHKGGFYGLPAPSYLRGIAREYTRLGFRHGVLTAAMLNAHRGFNRGAKVLK
jgi:hypothetical protein